MAGIADDMPGGPLAELALEPSPPAPYRWLRTAGWGFARVFSVLALAVAWEVAARSGRFHALYAAGTECRAGADLE